jgi:hypothetical protein
MVTLREWFDDFEKATGERPIAVKFGWGDRDYRSEEWPPLPSGVALFIRLDAVLDHEFDDDYGGNESPNLCAWSDNWVLFSDNYDGSESLRWVPRFMVDHDPIRPGGG